MVSILMFMCSHCVSTLRLFQYCQAPRSAVHKYGLRKNWEAKQSVKQTFGRMNFRRLAYSAENNKHLKQISM